MYDLPIGAVEMLSVFFQPPDNQQRSLRLKIGFSLENSPIFNVVQSFFPVIRSSCNGCPDVVCFFSQRPQWVQPLQVSCPPQRWQWDPK